MNNHEFIDMLTVIVNETFEKNRSFIADTIDNELTEKKGGIAEMYFNLLLNAMTLSAITTIKVLKELGVDVPGYPFEDP